VWTPDQIDEIAAHCQAWIESGTAPRQSPSIGIPAHLRPAGEPVIIYSAAWCTACATAEAYLARRRIAYVSRDVEVDGAAADERDQALARVGLGPTNAVPVVDVRGVVTVGFAPCVIERFVVADRDP
jgi:glutaredoxin